MSNPVKKSDIQQEAADFTAAEAKWVEIDLDAAEYNMRQIRAKVGPDRRIAAVIKSNAYGHGVFEMAEAFLAGGADQFAVSSLPEALELRRNYPDRDILILGSLPDQAVEQAVDAGLQLAVTGLDRAEAISAAAVKLGKPAKVHIKLDTGMTRIGFQMTPESVSDIVKISRLPGLVMDGIFTHYATADETSKIKANHQFERYMSILKALEKEGVAFNIRHTSNSAAIMEMPETYLDMVRPGIVQYGIYPSDEVDRSQLDIRPVMSFKARISQVKILSEDREISYGGRYKAERGTVIATIPVGYADGYTRCMSGKAQMIYKGEKYPVRGNICMDQCMLELTRVRDARAGDVVTLMGREGDCEISADDIGKLYGTIGYEVVCAVARRVPRVYIKNGVQIKKINYLD